MKKIKLCYKPNQFWNKGKVTIKENGKSVKKYSINRYYDVDEDYIYIYDVDGGQGIGYKKGKLLHKISLENAEYHYCEK